MTRRPLFFVGAAIAALVVAAAAYLLPYQGFQGEKFVEIPRGTSTRGIADVLAREGVIRYPWQFLIARTLRSSAKLQAGEYRFTGAASVRDVFGRMARGDIYYFEFTVPEGSNMFDIARSLGAQGVMQDNEFLQAAADPMLVSELIGDLAPRAKTLEGFLFPSTYRLSHATTAAQLARQMTDEFRKQWNKLGNKLENQVGANSAAHTDTENHTPDVERAVTLASMVEKETGVDSERPVVASVFTNRLEKGMRLECDPTTIYAALLDDRYRGVIHRSDLASVNPYNTYQNAGLPPGPIANPGASAIAAALSPAATNYLFFVAKPEGGSHQFSAIIAEHERAVIAYRHAAALKHPGRDASNPARPASPLQGKGASSKNAPREKN